MRSAINNWIGIIAIGFVVLLLLSLPLFWARRFCDVTLDEIMPHDFRYVRIRPSGLVPPELENDPNVVQHSYISANMAIGEPAFIFLGIVDYFVAREPEGRLSDIYYYSKKDDTEWIYFDQKIGQIVCCYIAEERMPDKTVLRKKVQLYAGPEGISETSDKTLGRFIRPAVDEAGPRWPLTLYDKKLRRFFQINFKEKTVLKGPELAKDDPHNPIQVGRIIKNRPQVNLYWEPPKTKISGEDAQKTSYPPRYTVPIINYRYSADQYVLILDESGRIDLLDKETLKFARTAGYLPAPETLYPSRKSVTPKDLLTYEVTPLSFRPESNFRGIYAAALCREGTAMALAVFDEKGKLIESDYTKVTEYTDYRRTMNVPTSKAVYFAVPWAPTLTIAKFLLENLHPPILSLVSYLTAYSFEAGAGHRALFILPNSFVAMKGRDVRQNAISKLGYALLLISPSLILSVFLAWWVEKDATLVGLSDNARLFWMIGTIAFGLAGYITYRLTQPKETLVTCANCGKLRRPNMEKCHRCGSKWHVPEITPPSWRVADT